MDCRPLRTALYFEELEPRLLYSADLAGVVDTDPEQDLDEEPVITADLDSIAESDDTAVLQAEEEGEDIPAEPEAAPETAAGGAGTVEESDDSTEPVTFSPPVADSAAGQTDPADSDDSIAADDPNIAPVLATPDEEVEYAPGDPPAIIAPEITVTDVDSDDFSQGSLIVSISDSSNNDELVIVEGGDVSIVGNSNIKVEQKLVGHFAGGNDGTALIISWTPLATPDCAEAVLRQIAYSNDTDVSPGSRTVDFVLTDGDGGTSNTVQAIINLTDGGLPGDDPGDGESPPGENIAPVLTQPGGPVDYTGGGEAVLIASTATLVDVDSADFKQGTLSVSFSQGGGTDDQLLIVEGGDVSLLDNNIKVEQKLVGSFAGGINGTSLIISWHPQATPEYAEAVLRQIAYYNGSAEPTPGSCTVDFVLTDGDGGTSNTVQAIINVTAEAGLPGEDPGEGEDDGEGETGGEDPGQGEDDGEGETGGEDPGQSEGEEDGEGETGGGEIIPPINDPIDEPINDPVDEQDDTPEPVGPGSGGQNNPEGAQEEEGSGGDDSGTVMPPVPPASDPVVQQKVEFESTDGSRPDFLAATGDWLDESNSAQEFKEKDDLANSENRAAQEAGPTFLDAANRIASDGSGPRPDGSAGNDKVDEGSVFSLPKQPAAPAAQGQGAGDVPHEATLSETLKTTMGRLLSFLAPSSATAAPAPPLDPDPATGDTPSESELVCREVEVMRQEMEEAFLQSNQAGKMTVYTTTGVSLSLAAGIARYFFHSGSLLSGFLATIPLWKGFDPVAILSTPKNGRKKTGAIGPSAGVETVEQKAETMFAGRGV